MTGGVLAIREKEAPADLRTFVPHCDVPAVVAKGAGMCVQKEHSRSLALSAPARTDVTVLADPIQCPELCMQSAGFAERDYPRHEPRVPATCVVSVTLHGNNRCQDLYSVGHEWFIRACVNKRAKAVSGLMRRVVTTLACMNKIRFQQRGGQQGH